MAIKYREAEDLRMATRQELTSSPENWLKFLRTASNTYKYNFFDQLLIFAQFPNAKAVAVFDVWSKTFGRKIREGEKGIGLIDDKGEYPRIKYVFDISQSSPIQPKKQQPYIWELTEENHQEVAFLLSSDKNKSIENALADTVEDTVNEMIDDYVNNSLNEDNSIKPEKFRQLVCDSVKYMVLQRCGLDTSSYIDSDIFSSLNEFSNPDVIDILGESISNISEQALRKVEQTVKTIERRNQNERNNAQNKNDRRGGTSSVRVEHDILSNDNSGQDNWSKLHTRPGNIHIPSSSERRGGYEGRGSLGATSPQVSQRKQEKNIDKANRHTQTDRPLDRSQRSSGETDGTARSGNDGSRGSNRRPQSNRPDEVGTNDELNQSKSRGNSSEQSDIRISITQENTVTKTAEDNSPAVFSFEQIGFFDFKVSEQQSEIDNFVNAVLMKGTGTEDGKFRVNDFFLENHTEKEKIDFLKEEFGWYGRYTSSESLESQPSKGLTLTRTDKENPENNLNIHLSWKEVVEHLDSMVSGKTYITEKDIAERQRHALYVLKNYSSDNPNDVYAIQKAKETLDSYNIDYNDILVSSNFKKIDQSEFINFASDIIKDKQRVINAHKNSNEQEYRLEIEIALNELVTELVTASMADEDFVITGYTAKETINFLNQYHNDTEMQKYVLDTVSENTDVVLSKIEETRQAAAKIGMAFSDKLYDSENDFDPFVYDGSMSIEDFRKVQDSILSEQKENEKTFAEQVDDVFSGKSNRYNDLKVCDTPQILLDIGCQQLPMLYTQKHLRESIKPKNNHTHAHGLTIEQIKELPKLISEPVMVFDSLSRNDSIVIVTSEVDKDNCPIIASVRANGKGKYELEQVDSNFITSVYGRENFEKHINKIIETDNMLYCNKQKSQVLFSVLGLQSSKGLNSLDFDIIIHRSRNIVNENIVEEKYSSEEQLSFDNMNPDSEKIANERTKQNEQKETQKKSEENIGQSSESNLDARRMGKTSLGDSVSRVFESSERNSNQLYEQSSINSNEYFNNKESIIGFAESTFGNGENIKIFQPNYRITDNNIGAGTQGQRFKANIAAITLLKQLETENRTATPDEQAVLAQYVGWGGLSEYFKESNPHYNELKNLLTESEYDSALASTLDSFYTPPIIIDSIYTVLENSGFNGGNILEPAMGIGNFFGKIPDSISENSKLYGVEIDSISGRIAKQLYPNANITINGFEKTRFQNNSFDVVLGNVPFGSFSINGMKIHDYFFMKSLDKVKPGGIIAFVTSTGTLDKKDASFREELAKQADFLGAIRLPSQSFKANAGTDVDADIIFLKKRYYPIAISENIPDWVQLGETENGISVNKYFENNPQMILGEMVEGNKLYGTGTICMPTDGDLAHKLNEAVNNIHAEFTAIKSEIEPLQNSTITPQSDLRNYSIFTQNNDIYYLENDNITCFSDIWGKKYNEKNIERAKLYIEIRDTVRDLLAIQQKNEPNVDDKIHDLQIKLNALYDNFNAKYGLINNAYNKQLFRKDVSFPLMLSLEEVKDNKLLRKSDIFTKRTIRIPEVVEKVGTPLEALSLSVVEKGKVDFGYMSSLTDMSKETIIDKLKGEIYPVPELSTDDNIIYQTASEYLSGDIYAKISVAEIEAKNNNIYYDNISALKAALPTPLKAGDIDIQLGATWVPIEYYQQFMYELFQTPNENRADRPARYSWQMKKKQDITIDYSTYTGRWNISNKSVDRSVTVTKTYGTEKRNAYAILESILNLQNPKVNKIVWENGEKKTELDIEATKVAEQRANQITEAFRNWIFKDPIRRNELVDLYNRQFNCIKPREYDGSAMTFPGMSSSVELHEHQKNAIAHALHGGNTLFAHCVGAGKTFEMIATAMESKRLGLCNKSLFAVPNHLTEQFGADFLKLYPAANILVATKDDFTSKNRSKLLAKIATGNYDAVIIGHSQLSMIPISPERQEKQYKQQIADITQGIEQLKSENGESFQVKQMERTKKYLEQKLEKLSATKKDNTVYFEELGIDKLFVDEAHEFKNLMCVTKLQNVSGISGKSSQRALELFMKCQYLDEITGGKGVVFATGTPISNSITELHTMMRYLQYDFLKQHGIQNFDNWVSIFGKQKTDYELSPTGDGFKIRTRIAEYANMPELMSMFKQVADVRTSDTIRLNVPECELHIINTEPTEIQKGMVEELSNRADKVNSGMVEPKDDNMLKITSDGRKAALDPRLIDSTLPDDPNTKLNQCVNNVLKIYQETSEQKLTQIIFCDLGVPKPKAKDGENLQDSEKSMAEMDSLEDCGRFCIYDDIKSKLIAQGVPANEIEFIHNAKTEQQKSELFAKVRSGEVRVLIGSTAKMGTGTNVQDRLIALHDLDVPWRPSDLEQRRGRIVRQGNQNKQVHLYRYVTKGTFDAYSYQLLENKQKFISQIITSKSPARKCSDVDQEALTYAEIKALCTADERIKEQLMLNNRVKELKMLKSEYTNTHYELEDKVIAYPAERESLCKRISNIASDFERCKQIPLGADGLPVFELRIGNIIYTDRKEAAKALESACNKTIAQRIDKIETVGSIYGFDFALTFEKNGQPANAVILGSESYNISLNSIGHYSLNKLEKAIFSIEKQLNLHQEQLNKLDTDIDSAKKILDKPFEFEDELSEKETRLFDLTKELKEEQVRAAKQDIKKERTHYFGKDKILGCFRKNNPKKNDMPEKSKDEVSR